MATIINNNDFILSPEQQQILSNAAANYGLDEIIIGEPSDDDGD